MEVLHPRCVGLDVHQKTVVACVRVAEERNVQQEVKTFETTTKGLLALAEWLKSFECTHVAMESTGVYWKPVWHVLEGEFELVLANASHIRNVPGRKTDVNDSMWIADLLAHGLIRSSFVPPEPVQQLRDLTRTRKQMVGEMSRHMQRIQKTLEDANIKLTGIISDIFGKSGRKVLQALIAGESRPEELVKLMDARIKAPRGQIADALHGRVTEHHRFLLKLHLDQIDALQTAVDRIESRIGEALRPFREAADLLTTIPGYGDLVAQTVVGEIGLDMSRFPSAGNLISWARLCPRSDESAGKHRSSRTKKGGRWLKTVLVQAAWSAVRAKNNYFRSQFFRLKARRGPMKAIIAVASSMLTAAYHMLKNRVPYRELGSRYLDTIDRQKTAQRLLKRLADIGVHVTPVPSPAVSF